MPALPFDQAVTPLLLRRFEQEGHLEDGDGRYYACVLRADNDLKVHHPFGPSASIEQILWAGQVLRLLNADVHHDGAWVLVFTHLLPVNIDALLAGNRAGYGRYALIWIDKDGDPQFTVEWLAGENADFSRFADVINAGIESTAQKCEAAWMTWHLHMRKIPEVREGQHTFRRAKGERAPSAR